MATMIPAGKRRLFYARQELQLAQTYLHAIRRHTDNGEFGLWPDGLELAEATENFYAALDHAWEMQCMVEGRL